MRLWLAFQLVRAAVYVLGGPQVGSRCPTFLVAALEDLRP